MIIKGIIKSIDYTNNTCNVRMPLFENANSGDEVVASATFSIQPGILNSYKEDDVVLIAFEDNDYDNPVVMGKLYLGLSKELADLRGAANIETLNVKKEASIPVTTKLTFDGIDDTAVSVDKSAPTYKSINDIIKGLQNQTKISDTQSGQLQNKVSNTQDIFSTGFGWELTDKAWKIQSYDDSHMVPVKNILTVDNSGVTIAGDLKIEGYPTKIIYYYLKTEKDAEPPVTPTDATWYDEGWRTSYEWEELKLVWESKRTYSYEYDGDTGLLKEISTWSTPICITGAKGDSGVDIISQITYYYLANSDAIFDPTIGPEDWTPESNTVPTIEQELYYYEHVAEPGEYTLQWSETPKEFEEGKKYWTSIKTLYSNSDITYTIPVVRNDIDGIYEITQGKSTNYYGDEDPCESITRKVKVNDCWFNTGYRAIGPLATRAEYNNKYIKLESTDPDPVFKDEIIKANFPKIITNWVSYVLYKRDGGYSPTILSSLPASIKIIAINESQLSAEIQITGTEGDQNYQDDWYKSVQTFSLSYSDLSTGWCFFKSANKIDENRYVYLQFNQNTKLTTRPENGYLQVKDTTPDRFITANTTIPYEHNELLQYVIKDETTTPPTCGWESIGEELVASKVTATFINALDITTKKITVIDPDTPVTAEHPEANVLFKADSTNHVVKIANWETTVDGLFSMRDVFDEETLAHFNYCAAISPSYEINYHPFYEYNNASSHTTTQWSLLFGNTRGSVMDGGHARLNGQFGVSSSGETFAKGLTIIDGAIRIGTDEDGINMSADDNLTVTGDRAIIAANTVTCSNYEEVIRYTAEEADAYNTEHGLQPDDPDYKHEGDPHKFTQEEAIAYNNAHNLHQGDPGYKVAGDDKVVLHTGTFTAEVANAETLNATTVKADTFTTSNTNFKIKQYSPQTMTTVTFTAPSKNNVSTHWDDDLHTLTVSGYWIASTACTTTIPITVKITYQWRKFANNGINFVGPDGEITPAYTLVTKTESFSGTATFDNSTRGAFSVECRTLKFSEDIVSGPFVSALSSSVTTRTIGGKTFNFTYYHDGIWRNDHFNYFTSVTAESSNGNVTESVTIDITVYYSYKKNGTPQTGSVIGHAVILAGRDYSEAVDFIGPMVQGTTELATTRVEISPTSKILQEPPTVVFENTYEQTPLPNDIYFFANLIPKSRSEEIYMDIGSEANQWDNIYGKNIEAGGVDTSYLHNGAPIDNKSIFSGTLLPLSALLDSGSQNLGENSINGKWDYIYSDHALNGSDLRIKTNINYNLDSYEKLFDSLQPTTYELKKEPNIIHFGLIAQDVEKALDNCNIGSANNGLITVPKNDNEIYFLNYSELHALEIAEIQRLKKQVKELTKELTKLKK